VAAYRSKSSLVLLAMVDAPQPTMNEDASSRLRARTRLRNPTLHDESKPPSPGVCALARARLLNRDQSIGTSFVQKQFSSYPSTSLPLPGARDTFPGRIE